MNKNINRDPIKIVLSKSPFLNVTSKELAQQIESKSKTEKKLPTWYSTKNIFYPTKLAIEQTTSEKVANYKAGLFSGNTLIDVTGGFGVDSFYFSKSFLQVIHCELNTELSEIVRHNFNVLKKENIVCRNQDGLKVLDKYNKKIDCIYLDPARRNKNKGKVIQLMDYEPNVLLHLEYMLQKSKQVVIKTSPMLDLHIGMKQLKYVREVYAISVKNELKELLWVLSKDMTERQTLINAVDIYNKDYKKLSYVFERNADAISTKELKQFLYEPNAAIMKIKGYDYIAEPFFKLDRNTHLFTSDKPFDFAGRSFMIIDQFNYNKAIVNQKLKGKKANVTVRNFPLSVSEIRKKYNLREGGDQYVFFTTCSTQKKVIICKKMD